MFPLESKNALGMVILGSGIGFAGVIGFIESNHHTGQFGNTRRHKRYDIPE
jgi:hypothetical protein